MTPQTETRTLIDGSRLIIEAMARAGADVYVGYPITPSNWLYAYAQQRFPVFMPAPDEISALQWAAGFATTGKLPVTATSFPGFALMLETLNMMVMMELPVVIVLSQRMGPSTGSATTGAQGDLLLLRGAISGGYPIPVLSPSNLEDCWELAGEAARVAARLRTPVVLLTSKEMVMTHHTVSLDELPEIEPAQWHWFDGKGEYKPYQADEQGVPPFLPVGDSRYQVRFNASTHDATGLIRKATPEALANTRRLREKIEHHLPEFTYFEHAPGDDHRLLLISYDISAEATREAAHQLAKKGVRPGVLILKTLLPLPMEVLDIINAYQHRVVVEENLSGLLAELVWGAQVPETVHRINQIGALISPSQITAEVERWLQ